MSTRRAALTLATILVVVVGALAVVKGIPVWSSGRDQKALTDILGSAAPSWLADAEVVAWTPDPNYKAQSYFAVASVAETDFKSWSATAHLAVTDTPSIPAGVFVLPKGVTLRRWVSETEAGPLVDAEGTIARASVWARWQGGVSYLVVHPTY